MSQGRLLHGQASEAREKGQFIESLNLSDQALFAYDEQSDDLGFSEGIANRSIALRVYANQKDSRRILTLAKYEVMGSVAIARESGNPKALALPLYNLAELQEDLGELSEAVRTYKEAVEEMAQNPPESHNRPAVLANMKIHKTVCEYKAGDKSALERALEALTELEAAEEPKYNKDVWVSGGYMRLSGILKKDDLEKAKKYLDKAREIIDANPDLELRKKQWEKLAASFD